MPRDRRPSPIRCLVVEDDRDDFQLIKLSLEDISEPSASVDRITDTRAALSALRKEDYAVCFVDYHLGHSDGIEFIKTAANEGVAVPIVLLTGSDDSAIGSAAAAAGAADFITKDDVSAKTLARTIRFALANGQKTRELRAKQEELEDTVARLAQQRSLLQLAMDYTKHGIAMFDSDRRLIACNSRYMEIYGFSDDVVRPGTHINTILRYSISLGNYGEQEAKRLLAERTTQVTSKEPSAHEQRLQDGRTISVSHVPIVGDLAVTTCEDITQTLKHRHVSALDMGNAALSEAVVAAKARFLSNMSHELRTPLNAIIGFNDIARNEVFGPLGSDQYREYADHIAHSAASLLAVVERVLDMSLIYGDELVLNEEALPAAELLEAVCTERHDNCEQKRIALQTDFSICRNVIVTGDRSRLSQAIGNVLDNAIKFSLPKGSIAVSAELSESRQLVIRIQDEGSGMSREQIERLLMPFEQAEPSDHRESHGIGLGLPIARGFVRLHGGDLAVDSKFDVGTVVEISLPSTRLSSAGRRTTGPT